MIQILIKKIIAQNKIQKKTILTNLIFELRTNQSIKKSVNFFTFLQFVVQLYGQTLFLTLFFMTFFSNFDTSFFMENYKNKRQKKKQSQKI